MKWVNNHFYSLKIGSEGERPNDLLNWIISGHYVGQIALTQPIAWPHLLHLRASVGGRRRRLVGAPDSPDGDEDLDVDDEEDDEGNDADNEGSGHGLVPQVVVEVVVKDGMVVAALTCE